ncbi:hypothetical protein SS7213T_11075 [Staphylococcus simiae CCM 7213 = CCUG 51256]|uniref:Uncharacterized protein n=1 Tax=Staphylococcus simiae CCM 7213 = CCUG 51256 TaxID=911238 RepID=G5JL50_9STAP|nr:hypothetical protein SS7213T_11075 [Staphylococcus simiae CCM 7213 = CCUG 51256]
MCKTGKVGHWGPSKEKFCQQNFHYNVQAGVRGLKKLYISPIWERTKILAY